MQLSTPKLVILENSSEEKPRHFYVVIHPILKSVPKIEQKESHLKRPCIFTDDSNEKEFLQSVQLY